MRAAYYIRRAAAHIPQTLAMRTAAKAIALVLAAAAIVAYIIALFNIGSGDGET